MRIVHRIVLTLLSFPLFAVPAQARYSPMFHLSARPSVDVPMYPDDRLYGPGGSVSMTGTYSMPFYTPLCVGLELGYRLAPLRDTEVGRPGSVSALSVGGLMELRYGIGRAVELSIAASGGYYIAFLNDDLSSNGYSYCAGFSLGLGYRVTSRLTLGLHAAWRIHAGLYLFGPGPGVYATYRLGGET